MGRHWWCRSGFREIYESSEDWHEERCTLFKYKTVNYVFAGGGEVYINRLPHRCYRCAYYPTCFKYDIIWSKYLRYFFHGNDDGIMWILLDLNSCDEEVSWRD